MIKLKMPKIKKGPAVHPRRPFGLHAAFSAGANRAFRDPATMAAPDQAFTAAMARPQDAASLPAPTLPTLPPAEG